jgi:Ribosomal protein L7/L12
MTREEIIKAIEEMSVLELSQLVKDLEEKFGVSAAAPAMMASARWPPPLPPGRGREDRVRRYPEGPRRKQDRNDQGRSRDHQPRPEGSQGTRRQPAEGRQGRRHQGRGRGSPEEAGRGRSRSRDQVVLFTPVSSAGKAESPFPVFLLLALGADYRYDALSKQTFRRTESKERGRGGKSDVGPGFMAG